MKVFYIATLLVILVALPLSIMVLYFFDAFSAGVILVASIVAYVILGIRAVCEIS